jgi:PAS domain-containing protein
MRVVIAIPPDVMKTIEQHSDSSEVERVFSKTVKKKSGLIQGFLQTSFSSAGVYSFLHHRIVYSQWRLLQSMGYSKNEYSEISERLFHKIMHPNDILRKENFLNKLKTAAPDQVLKCLVRICDKSGVYHWVAIRASALSFDKDGEVKEAIGSVLDVTSQQRAKKKLSQRKEMIRQLSFRNSHELRAPVATMLGLLTLVKHDLKTKDVDQWMIDSLEETMLRMDKAIRDFSHSLTSTLQDRNSSD